MRKIGVVIATYNGEKYIIEQLNSIINQTIKPDLIVVSDGGSKDNTVELCNECLSRCDIDYIVLTSVEQLNVTRNFEIAYASCDAEYVFFADQDDVWKSNKIQIVMELMEKNKAVLGFTNADLVDENLNSYGQDLWSSIGFIPGNKEKLFPKSDINFINRLLKRNVVTGMCMCVHDSVKAYILPFSRSTIHDVWIALVCANLGTILSIDEKSVLYRQHRDNVIGTKTSLLNSLKKGKYYKQTIYNRYELIDDLLDRLGLGISKDIISSLTDYQKYLRERINFINKVSVITSPYRMIMNYKAYEIVPFKVLFRDLISRSGVI